MDKKQINYKKIAEHLIHYLGKDNSKSLLSIGNTFLQKPKDDIEKEIAKEFSAILQKEFSEELMRHLDLSIDAMFMSINDRIILHEKLLLLKEQSK